MFMLERFQLMEKICIMNMSVYHSFEKNETATMFFLKKDSLVLSALFCKLQESFQPNFIIGNIMKMVW